MSRPFHFALIGEKIEYSLSPRIFNSVFNHLGVQGQFELRSVSTYELGTGVRNLVREGVSGFSVTIPHKRAVADFVDECDPVAASLGAVNSVRIDRDKLTGYNTDVYGASRTLKLSGADFGDGPALVFGNGGSARAVVYALYAELGVRAVIICGRSEERLTAFKNEMNSVVPDIKTLLYSDCHDAIVSSTLIVNCTPLGGANYPDLAPFEPDMKFPRLRCYFDLNYNRGNRPVRQIKERGVIALDGSTMLVSQALRSFELWTGQAVAFEPIYRNVFGENG